MSLQWAVLQLKEHVQAVRVRDLEQDLVARWPEAICRFPAVRLGLLDRDNPLSTYVFVQTPASLRLETSPYATHYLRVPGTSRLQCVTDRELRTMVVPPVLPPCGTLVRILGGDWADMEGVVVAQNCSRVAVLLELWSKSAVIELPPSELMLL
jgi:hypothetical protein